MVSSFSLCLRSPFSSRRRPSLSVYKCEIRRQAQTPGPTKAPALRRDGSQRPLLPASPMGLDSREHKPHFPPRANVETYPPFIDLGHWERPQRLRKLMGVAGGGASGRWGARGGGVGCITGLGRWAGSSAWRWASVSRRQVPQSDDKAPKQVSAS